MLNLAQRRMAVAWSLAFVWMGLIFLASTDLGSASHTSLVIEPLVHWIKPDATDDQVDFVHFLVRKAAHLTEYAVLGLLVFRAVRLTAQRLHQQVWLAAASALGICALYAASDEFHQSFVGGRTACVQDVLIDSCGAFLSIAGATAVIWRLRRQKASTAQAPADPALETAPR